MSVNIRILHMIGSLGIGGSQAFIMNIYRKIDRDKIQFDFIVDSFEGNYYVNEIKKMGGRVFFSPKFNGKNYFKVARFWKNFFIQHKEYKILHSHVRSYASIYLPIARSFGVKTIIHSHSTSNGKGIRAAFKGILQFPLRYQADYYLACSKEAGEWLFGKKICRSKKFQTLNNAIDTNKYIFNEEGRKKIRREFSLQDEFVLGYLSRVTAAKNPIFVIDVMKELLEIIPKAKLLFVGGGELLFAVKEKIKKLGLEEKVVITGPRTDVGDLMSSMDCYILPSVWEGLGISLIEAQASGLPCVCSEAIQNEAIITNLVHRYSLKLGAKTWAKAISTLKQAQRRDMSADIKRANFDINDTIYKLINIYDALIIDNSYNKAIMTK